MIWTKQWSQENFNPQQVIDTWRAVRSGFRTIPDMLFVIVHGKCTYFATKQTQKVCQQERKNWGKITDCTGILSVLIGYILTEDIVIPQDLPESECEKVRKLRLKLRKKWMRYYYSGQVDYSSVNMIFQIGKKGCHLFPISHLSKFKFDVQPKQLQGIPINIIRPITGKVWMDGDKRMDGWVGRILVVPNARPDYIPLFTDIIAFVSDEGGVTSHAVHYAMTTNVPCIVGTQYATERLKTDDTITLNPDGTIKRRKNG